MNISWMLLLILVSCSAADNEYKSESKSIKEGNIRWITYYKFGIVELAGCEYIVSNIHQGFDLTHKGNCKYCLQRNNFGTLVKDTIRLEVQQ